MDAACWTCGGAKKRKYCCRVTQIILKEVLINKVIETHFSQISQFRLHRRLDSDPDSGRKDMISAARKVQNLD